MQTHLKNGASMEMEKGWSAMKIVPYRSIFNKGSWNKGSKTDPADRKWEQKGNLQKKGNEAKLEAPCFHPVQPENLCFRIQKKLVYEILLLVRSIISKSPHSELAPWDWKRGDLVHFTSTWLKQAYNVRFNAIQSFRAAFKAKTHWKWR